MDTNIKSHNLTRHQKELKKKMFKLLDKHGKLRKEPWAKYIDEELWKDFIHLCEWHFRNRP
jgi:hypothetical protein